MKLFHVLKKYFHTAFKIPVGEDRLIGDPDGKTVVENITHRISPPRRRPYLVAFTGRRGMKRFRIKKGKTTVGRSPRADIVLKDTRISGIHCVVENARGRIFIEDRESTNGTYMNGLPIKREAITTASILQIGRTVMKIEYRTRSEIEYENELIRKATTDSATGILNKAYFVSRAEEEITLAARRDAPVALIMLDIDFFKKVNDTYGHQAGDYVINQLSMLINSQKRAEDLFGRFGGEEFIVFIRGDFDLQRAVLFCERIRRSVEKYPFRFDGRKIPVTVSIGLCFEYGKKVVSLDDLIARADAALYRAKHNGRNRVECSRE